MIRKKILGDLATLLLALSTEPRFPQDSPVGLLFNSGQRVDEEALMSSLLSKLCPASNTQEEVDYVKAQ